MKQIMKRTWLVLCMAACLFSLSACAAAETSHEEVDPIVSMTLTKSLPGLLTQITQLSEDQLLQNITTLEKEKNFLYADIFSSWQSLKQETGAIVEVISTTVAKEEDGYSCLLTGEFEKRNVDIKVMLDDQLEITAISFTPEYSMGEKMVKALYNTLMGLGTVFAVLIFIIFIISLFKHINTFENRMKARPEAAVLAAEPVPAEPVPAEPVPAEPELVNDLELVAVMTAAIAASQNTSTNGLVVRSIKRASGAKWKRA